jgi:hypothetical protein
MPGILTVEKYGYEIIREAGELLFSLSRKLGS